MYSKNILKILLFYILIVTPFLLPSFLPNVHGRKIRSDNIISPQRLQQEITSIGYSKKESEKISSYISNIFPNLIELRKEVRRNPKKVMNTLIEKITNSVKKAGIGAPSIKNSNLLDVVKSGKANCIGYTQLFYITAKTLGLDVDILVVDSNHVINRIKLGKDKYAMIDLISRDYTNSNPTVIEVKNWSERYKLKNPKSSTWEANTQQYNFIRVLDDSKEIESLLWTNKGIRLINEENKLSKGIKYLNQALSLDSYNATAYNNLGYTYVKQRQPKYDKAIKNFKNAIKLNPYYSLAYNNLANVLYELGNFKQALIKAQKAIELNPESGRAWVTSGLIKYLHLGENNEGILEIKKGLRYVPHLYDGLPQKIKDKIKDFYMYEIFPH